MHIFAQAAVAQEKAHVRRGDGRVGVVRAAPAEDLVHAFGKGGLETKAGQQDRKVVVVDEFGVQESRGLLAEEIFYAGGVLLDLAREFVVGVEVGEGVVLRLADEFHATRVGKGFQAVHGLGHVLLEKVERRARYGEGYLEGALVPPDEFEQEGAQRQVACAGVMLHAVTVLVVVLVDVVFPEVEDRVSAELIRFVQCQAKVYRRHVSLPVTAS